jgi:hypothetical protein
MSKGIARAGAVVLGMMLAGCAAQPDVEVRAVGAAARMPAGSDEIALARGAMALGNVGMALEQFRAALRAHPDSQAALRGIASCYDEMGRADLARRYYEEALALAPADLPLLRQYAGSLAHHGAAEEAQAVVAEIALRTKAPAAQWVIEPVRAAPVAEPAAAPVPSAAMAPPVDQPAAAAAPARAPAKTVRLERLSLGEIALVTTGTPIWRVLPMATVARPVRLLNAARRQGLAARNREQLAQAGWRRVTIGDAPRVRLASLVLYPADKRSEARQLADRVRIGTLRQEARADILVLLGRDRG